MQDFLQALKNKRARKEFIKSCLVGVASTILDFFITATVLYMFDSKLYGNFFNVFFQRTADLVPYSPPISTFLTATLVGFCFSVTSNYLLSTFFVYEYGNVGRNRKGILKFLIFALIGLTLTLITSLVGNIIFPNMIWGVKIIVSVLVAILNFFTRKYFVFNIALIKDDENTINL